MGESVLFKKMSDLEFKPPIAISGDSLLFEAVRFFKDYQVDNIVVKENNKPIGMIDIQDFVKMGLVG